MTSASLRVAGYQPETSVHTRAMRKLIDSLSRSVGATCDISFVPNITERGRPASDAFRLVEAGELDLCYFSSSYLAARVPALAWLDIPFLFEDRAAAFAQLDGARGEAIAAAIAAATGYRVLAWWDNGFRHFSNRRHAIRTPADCAGLRLRVVDSALHHEIFAALGFVPIHVDVKELPGAVAAGTVDAQENPLTNILNFNLQRWHRFVSLTAHHLGISLVLTNRAWLAGLPPQVQRALGAAVDEATAHQRALAAAEDTRCLAQLAQEGVEILSAQAIDGVAFRAAVEPIAARERMRLKPLLATNAS